MSTLTGKDLQRRLKVGGKRMPHGYQVVARKKKKKSSALTLRRRATKRRK